MSDEIRVQCTEEFHATKPHPVARFRRRDTGWARLRRDDDGTTPEHERLTCRCGLDVKVRPDVLAPVFDRLDAAGMPTITLRQLARIVSRPRGAR